MSDGHELCSNLIHSVCLRLMLVPWVWIWVVTGVDAEVGVGLRVRIRELGLWLKG